MTWYLTYKLSRSNRLIYPLTILTAGAVLPAAVVDIDVDPVSFHAGFGLEPLFKIMGCLR
jgi:hypothetical protein